MWEDIIKFEYKYKDGLQKLINGFMGIRKQILASAQKVGQGTQSFDVELDNKLNTMGQSALGTDNVIQVELPDVSGMKGEFDYLIQQMMDLKTQATRERATGEFAQKIKQFTVPSNLEQYIEKVLAATKIYGKVELTGNGYNFKKKR